MTKHFFIFVFVLLLAAGGGTGWFLFQQSVKLKSLNHDQAHDRTGEIRHKVMSEGINSTAALNASLDDSAELEKSEHVQAGNQTGQEAADSWAEQFFFTPNLVQDGARFLVEHYHPPQSPNDKGSVQMSFRIINARYGMDFLTVHTPQNEVKEMRKRLLGYALHPKVLKQLYRNYAGKVVDAWQAEAAQASTQETENDLENGQPRLSRIQTAEMFRLYAQYFQELGRLWEALSHYSGLIEDVQRVLQAEKTAEQASYMLNKKGHALDNAQGQELQTLEQEKAAAKEDYRQALKRREGSKERILEKIQNLVPGKMDLPDHEILYVAKWVQRRGGGDHNGEVLDMVSDLLQDFSARLQSRSRQIVSEEQAAG
ncbi:MAG: hypothetical protein U5L00_17155 [Desulfovermiculus sp.]|nr:hypothetical protein [Desulfovermiculus sp.]